MIGKCSLGKHGDLGSDLQPLSEKVGNTGNAFNLSAGEGETRRSQGLLASQLSLIGMTQV